MRDLPEWEVQALAHLDRAFELFEGAKDYAAALVEVDAALSLDPDLDEGHNLRGVLLQEMGRPMEALAAYREALRLRPDFEMAREKFAELRDTLSQPALLVTIQTYSFPTLAHLNRAWVWPPPGPAGRRVGLGGSGGASEPEFAA